MSRLAVHADDWDDIPDRLPGGGRHAIRVDWFTTIPRHTISVTADGKGSRSARRNRTGRDQAAAHPRSLTPTRAGRP